jgi:hypothetical protein
VKRAPECVDILLLEQRAESTLATLPSMVELLENLLHNLDSDYQTVSGHVSDNQWVDIKG